MNWDFEIFRKINGLAGSYSGLDFAGVFFAKYIEYILVLYLIVLLLYDFKRHWPMVKTGLAAVLLSRLGLTELIRLLLPRTRPFVENHINLLIQFPADQPAFPSGHASFFFALSAVVFFYNKKTGILFFVASFLISISRIFVGVHWPSDILAGALVGIFSGWFVIKVFRKLP